MFKPIADYLLVKPVERKQSDTITVITGEKFTQGIVLAVGPGKRNNKKRLKPLDVKPGDFITYGDLNRGYDFYPKYEEDGEIYRILQESDVCFVADPDHPAHKLPDPEIAQMVSDHRVLQID